VFGFFILDALLQLLVFGEETYPILSKIILSWDKSFVWLWENSH